MYRGFHSGRFCVSSVEDKLSNSFRIFRSENHCDISAVAEPENIRLFDFMEIHKILQIFRKLINRKKALPPWEFFRDRGCRLR